MRQSPPELSVEPVLNLRLLEVLTISLTWLEPELDPLKAKFAHLENLKYLRLYLELYNSLLTD
jgi:hypothetical protein